MKKLNNKGFGVVEVLILVIAIGVITAVTVYYVDQQQKKDSSTTTSQSTSKKEVETSQFQNDDLRFVLTFPKAWGSASLTKGDPGKYASGSYSQVTFTKQPQIDINLVTGAYSSPLDGCGLKPVENEIHNLNAMRASVIGWQDDDILRYMSIQGQGPQNYKVNVQAGDSGPGWVKIESDQKVLVYKDAPKSAVYAEESSSENGCFDISKSEAEEANAYAKYIRYALNYTNNKVKGVNAQYDARSGVDETLQSQIVDVLDSVK